MTIAPEDEKAGRGETLPLRKVLADDLAAYFKDHPAKPDAPAFSMNVRNEGAKMVAFDLSHTGDPENLAAEKRARGETPLEAIPVLDAAGHVADFHSLRHTFGTNLALAGVHPKVAQDLMRHSSIELTMNVYSHTKLESRAAALAGLPNVAAPVPPANPAPSASTPPASQSA